MPNKVCSPAGANYLLNQQRLVVHWDYCCSFFFKFQKYWNLEERKRMNYFNNQIWSPCYSIDSQVSHKKHQFASTNRDHIFLRTCRKLGEKRIHLKTQTHTVQWTFPSSQNTRENGKVFVRVFCCVFAQTYLCALRKAMGNAARSGEMFPDWEPPTRTIRLPCVTSRPDVT